LNFPGGSLGGVFISSEIGKGALAILRSMIYTRQPLSKGEKDDPENYHR
jgi:hypothetical protein